MRVRPATRAELPWLETHADCTLSPKATAMAAVDSRERIRGMVGYDNFTPNACQVHQALAPAAGRVLLKHAFVYPFLTLGLGVLLGCVASTNGRALALNSRLGFRETHRTRDGYGQGVDMVWMEMRREECRWLAPKGG